MQPKSDRKKINPYPISLIQGNGHHFHESFLYNSVDNYLYPTITTIDLNRYKQEQKHFHLNSHVQLTLEESHSKHEMARVFGTKVDRMTTTAT
jgi:hypothetical protein